MGRDRSLDEFLDAGGETGDRDGSSATATDDAGAETGAELDVRPAAITMAYAPDGASCEACGETVERRWHDGDGLVCAACKEW